MLISPSFNTGSQRILSFFSMSGAQRSQTLTALTLVGLFIISSAAPQSRYHHDTGTSIIDVPPDVTLLTKYITLLLQDLDVNITVCTAPDACSIVPGQSGNGGCTDLLDHFGFLFKEITSATIPGGFACTFYEYVAAFLESFCPLNSKSLIIFLLDRTEY